MVTAAGRYSQLEAERAPYLDRARKCAKLTIPSLFPDDGHSSSSEFSQPYQSIGARGVNTLASKLLITEFPPHQPHFKMGVDELTLLEITGREGMQAEVEKALGAIVKRVMAHVEARGVRPSVFEVMKQLLVAGNGCLYLPEHGSLRTYRLDKYVCKRDPGGVLLELIIKEKIAQAALPPEVLSVIPAEKLSTDQSKSSEGGPVNPPTESVEKDFDLYTHVFLEGDKYVVYQEVEGIQIPGTEGSYPIDRLPYLVLRMIRVDGESYGRSYVEEYLGDLTSLEALTRALVEYTAVASRVIIGVNPNGTTSIKKVATSKTGDVVSGDLARDVTVLTLDKYQDLRVAREMIKELEERLAYAFLLHSAIQRPGERVTAEEIRFMAQELDDGLGGVYTLQSQELQLPLTKVLLSQLEKTGQLPPLPKQIMPQVITGIDALGRGHDLATLDTFIAPLAQNPATAPYINWADYAKRRANALGIDTAGLIKTPEEVAAEQQQAMMMQMMDRLGPNAINQLGGIAQKSMETQTNGPSQDN